jgi:CBS domain-containing protein
MRVRDLMRSPVVFCHPETNLAEAAGLMWDRDCGALPVVNESGKVTGLITDRDMCVALGTRNKPASEIAVRDVISRVPRTCGPDDPIHAALRTMSKARVRRLPVVDRAGRLEGILCLHDILLRAQHCDGTTRPGVSYEDVVNTLVAICQYRSPQRAIGRSVAA